MKKSFLYLCFVIFLSLSESMEACPVRPYRTYIKAHGIIKVQDKNGKSIPDAVIWKVYGPIDSIKLEKGILRMNYNLGGELDSFLHHIYSKQYGRMQVDTIDGRSFHYRVHADGYADLIVEDFLFLTGSNAGTQFYTITLEKPQKLYIENKLREINEYEYGIVYSHPMGDSSSLNREDYLQFMREQGSLSPENLQDIEYTLNAYPNPAVESINIELKETITLPFKAVITDLFGKKIREFELTENISKANVQDLASAYYFLSVFNAQGELKYGIKFLKN